MVGRSFKSGREQSEIGGDDVDKISSSYMLHA